MAQNAMLLCPTAISHVGLFEATTVFHVEAWVCPCYLSQRDPCFGPIMGKHSTGVGWELRMGRDGIQMMVTLRKRQMTWHEVVACSQDVQLGVLSANSMS